jgi:translocation and assembly module TamB
VDARADVLGPWKSWEGSFQLSADALRLGEQELGSVTVSGYSAGAKEINVVAYARYQQISLRLRMPHSLSGPSTLYARTRGLDLGFLLPMATVAKHNLFTQVDGEVLFNGPAPLTPQEVEGASWLSRWEAQGSLTRALFQTRQLRFALEKPSSFRLKDGRLSAPQLRLVAPAGFVEMAGVYDFRSAEVEADVDASVKLGILEDLFGKVGDADGNFVIDVRMEGVVPELSVTGDAKLEGGSIALRDYPPPFTDIEGTFLFGEDSIEIRSLRAKKGTGDVEIAGSVTFTPWMEDASRAPIIAMRMRARDAQVRIPTPYLEFFDTTLDGSLELFGSERPYTLAGNLRVKRAASFRDKTCQDLLAEEAGPRVEELRIGSQAFANLNVQVLSDNGIFIQTACVKTRLSANVKVTGTTDAPLLSGVVDAESSGTVSFLKSNFTIQRAEFVFDNPVRLDPRIDIQLNSRIETYTVFVQVDGTLSRRRTNLWVDPPNTPDGATLGRPDIFRMLSTGQPPNRAGTQGQALVVQAAAYGTSILALDDSLTQAAQRLTGGFVDSVQLQPVIENGQTRWKARVSRSLGERLSLGLDIEQGQAVNNQSLNGTVFINDSVNLLGGFDRKSEQSEQYYELSGGLRFQFGSSR